MFGALNRFISRLDSDGPSGASRDGRGAYGFQVLRNKNAEIAIEPWYDFVIGINGRPLDTSDASLFAAEIRNCAGNNVSLTLWNAKGSRPRTLSLPVPTPSPTLGLTLQWTALSITHDVWHILEVTPHSPADNAGLLPYGDYIVGSPEGTVHGESGLGELVEDYISRSLRLFVYNHEYGVTRLVTITPSRSWGGGGALGCVLGFGALHRLPAPLNEPPPDPGETMFETTSAGRFSNEERRMSSASAAGGLRSYGSGTSLYQNAQRLQSGDGFLVPANLPSGGAAGAGPGAGVDGAGGDGGGALSPLKATATTKAPRKARKGPGPGDGFDDMFKEGEEKSKEEDRPSTRAPTSNAPPPPPKAGGKGLVPGDEGLSDKPPED